MTGDQDLLIQAFRAEIAQLPERCPGYHKAVFDALGDIVRYEREFQTAKIPVIQKMKESTEVLAKFVQSREKEA